MLRSVATHITLLPSTAIPLPCLSEHESVGVASEPQLWLEDSLRRKWKVFGIKPERRLVALLNKTVRDDSLLQSSGIDKRMKSYMRYGAKNSLLASWLILQYIRVCACVRPCARMCVHVSLYYRTRPFLFRPCHCLAL